MVRFVRKWLDLPISATLSGISLPRNQFGLNLLLPSVKFLQCQTVLRTALKSSSNDAIKSLWRSTGFGMNIQYDTYRNTRQVLKAVRQSHTDKLGSHLTSQGFLITFLLNHSLRTANSLWSSAQSKLPKNIFNFTVRYLNNTLATRKNLKLWNLSQTSDCSFCFQPASLLHVVAYLSEGRFTWRYDSALNFLASTFQYLNHCTFYVDLPQYRSPSLVTGDDLRPDMLISTPSNAIYVLELSVGFETNLDNNADRKVSKYRYLLNDLTSKYRHVKFVNLSISSLGIFGQSCDSFIQMCSDLTIGKAHTNYIITKLSTIIIRTTYYIFCMRTKPWTNPDLLSY